MLKCYIGYDPAQAEAYRVAEASLRRRASIPVDVTPLRADRLALHGLLRRPVDARGGQMYDLRSNAPQSTEFAQSRFLVPLLAQSGWALFVDSDVVFLDDVAELLAMADDAKALQVVKHGDTASASTKMAGKEQTVYPFKWWSSVMLFNCEHRGNSRLSLDAINHWPGRDLHAFHWLSADEIGDLPPAWNWLVGVQPRPKKPSLAHFTLGGPWMKNWKAADHDELWISESRPSDTSGIAAAGH